MYEIEQHYFDQPNPVDLNKAQLLYMTLLYDYIKVLTIFMQMISLCLTWGSAKKMTMTNVSHPISFIFLSV